MLHLPDVRHDIWDVIGSEARVRKLKHKSGRRLQIGLFDEVW